MDISLPKSKQKWQDALRLAIQSSVAAGIAFACLKWMDSSEIFVGILSAVLVIEASVGSTIGAASSRVLATIVGSAIGFGLIAVLPYGYGTAIGLIVSMFVINGIAGIKPDWRYGVVAAVAIALQSEEDPMNTALNRLLSIGLCAGIGIVVSLVVWPDTAKHRAEKFITEALKACAKRLKVIFKNTREENEESIEKHSGEFHTYISKASDAASAIKKGDAEDKMQRRVKATESLYNSILILKRVAEESSGDVTDGDSNIEKDSEAIAELARELICKFAEPEENPDQGSIDKFTEKVKELKEESRFNEESKEQTILTATFLFAMDELEDSFKELWTVYEG